VARLPGGRRQAWIKGLGPGQITAIKYGWRGVRARPEQLAPPGDWRIWLVCAGRGFGKTRCGAEWIREQWKAGCTRMALVGATAADVRDVMIEGDSGLMNVGPPDERPVYEPSKRRITYPNGAMAFAYSADEPERLRGPQHSAAWCDDISAWRHQRSAAREELVKTVAERAWSNLMLGLRIGNSPRACVTFTPKTVPLVRKLLARKKGVVLTTGSTYDNLQNLADDFFDEVTSLEGTRLGRQEISGHLLEDVEGALWSMEMIETTRAEAAPELRRVVVAVDPPGGHGGDAAEAGIVVAGRSLDNHGYVLADLSGQYSPDGWARRAIQAYEDFKADAIVAEVNYGGDMVEATLLATKRTMRNGSSGTPLHIKKVHASRGKQIRAEPIAAVYEQERIHHVGILPGLEDQMTTWAPTDGGPSPDRLDALVWALTDLEFGSNVATWRPGSAAVVGAPLAGSEADW
jgi:phage terminase large subunit-like protein